MYNKMHKSCQLHRIWAILAAFIILFTVASCQQNEPDDKTMTDSLIKDHLNALCSFDIPGMNKNNMGKIDQYSDSQDAKSACKIIAGKITWSVESININSSTAIAQIKINVPTNTSDVCASALNNTMRQIEQGSSSNPGEIICNEIKKQVDKFEFNTISSEVHMSKVGNKWYISKSPDTAEVISDIRTQVIAIYSVVESR